MDFKQNYFEIFQLPAEFLIDTDELADRYRQLQRSIHPDKFAGASDRDRRMSMQWTTKVNEAYATLKKSLPRAIYLLKLNGVDMADKQNAPVDPSFLMQQMMLREALDEIGEDEEALTQLGEFRLKADEVLSSLEAEFDDSIATDIENAVQTVLKMQYMSKLILAADQLEEKLLDY